MMIKRSPNLSAMRRKSYEAVLRFQICKVKHISIVSSDVCRTGVAQSPCKT